MSNHGDIQIIDKNAPNHSYWLHAYSNGQYEKALHDLLTIPEWLLARSKMEFSRNKDIHETGSVGSYHLEMLINFCKQSDPKSFESDFETVWMNTSLNLQECSAVNLANYMVTKHFSRWHVIQEEVAPWHKMGEEPDLTVLCDSCYDNYHIKINQSIVQRDELENNEEYVGFSNKIYNLFKREVRDYIYG